MNISDLIGTLALLVALMVLVYQTIKIEKQISVQNYSEYTRRYNNVISKLPFSVILDDFDFRKLKEPEFDLLIRTFLEYFDLCSEEFFLHEHRYVNKKIWKNWKEGIRAAMSRKAFKDAWKIVKEKSYYNNNSFIEMMNEFAKSTNVRL